jgi:hypothetical protein
MLKEEPIVVKKSFRTAAVVVAATLMLTLTAFAAWHFLTPSQVADHFGDRALSAAFGGENAININASQTDGGFTFTLMSIISGNDITDFPTVFSDGIRRDRTYAVVAIQKADSSPIDRARWEQGEYRFYISPYIRGFQPWQLNAHTLGGGGQESLIDGVIYTLIDTNDISIFADRGVYIGITEGRLPPGPGEAFILNEVTGEITSNPNFTDVNALFDLPLDISLADPVRAQQFIDNFMEQWFGTGEVPDNIEVDDSALSEEAAEMRRRLEERARLVEEGLIEDGQTDFWFEIAESGEIMPLLDWFSAEPVTSTVRVLTVDNNGYVNFSWRYENGNGSIRKLFNDIFPIPHIPGDRLDATFNHRRIESPGGVLWEAVRFTIDGDGVFTGAVVVLSE